MWWRLSQEQPESDGDIRKQCSAGGGELRACRELRERAFHQHYGLRPIELELPNH
jgi:hypothetical protein